MSDNPLILQYSDGQLVPYQTPDPAAAAQRALDFTGIPDLVSGVNALARGEYLPGLGQAASGAAGLLPLGKLAGAAKLGAELMPVAGMIRAWHGTPHLFEPAPARAVEESGITAYHATPEGFSGNFDVGTHFGSLEAAHDRLQDIFDMRNELYDSFKIESGEEAPAVYRVKLKPNKILDVPDLGEFHPSDMAQHLRRNGIITEDEFKQIEAGNAGPTGLLIDKGYDALRYTNDEEAPGSLSYMVLNPTIIHPTHRLEPGNPFGEFRDAAIGTGAGAQAYGHGHYVAGNQRIAETYAYRPSDNENAGHMLEVHILPDEHELLDWDRPLAEQPPGVKAVIDQIHAENEDLRIINSDSNITGENFYRNLAQNLFGESRAAITNAGQIAASRHLHEAGIPGIKYFDQGSQARGEGTSNYVIFDPKNLRIVGRNGQRLEPVDEDPFK